MNHHRLIETPALRQVTCTHGFATMEDCHVKVVEELQRRHQQEVERLLVERDRLLEEESTATATGEGAGRKQRWTGCEFPKMTKVMRLSLCRVSAIEAIKNAHRLELEREVQKRQQTEVETGDARLEDACRRHRCVPSSGSGAPSRLES